MAKNPRAMQETRETAVPSLRLGISPGKGNGPPTLVFLPGKSRGQGSLVGMGSQRVGPQLSLDPQKVQVETSDIFVPLEDVERSTGDYLNSIFTGINRGLWEKFVLKHGWLRCY